MENKLIDANATMKMIEEAKVKYETSRTFAENIIRFSKPVFIIPENPTNGDMIKALFPKGKVKHEPSITHDRMVFSFPDGTYFGAECRFNTEWWNAPYEREENENANT